MHADRSAARKAAEAAMLPFRDGPHLTTKVTAEAVWNLAVAMDALLAEQDGAGKRGAYHVGKLVAAMKRWAADEDGLPMEVFDSYNEAVKWLTHRPAPSPLTGPPRFGECGVCMMAPCACAERTAPPPAGNEVREDPVLGWAKLAVGLLQRHASAWDHDPGPGDDDCDEDCRACEYEALLKTGKAALSSVGGPRG